MTDHTEEETSDDLVAKIVKQNVDDLAATNEKLIRIEKNRATRFADILIILLDAIDQVQMIDRTLLSLRESVSVQSVEMEAVRFLSGEDKKDLKQPLRTLEEPDAEGS